MHFGSLIGLHFYSRMIKAAQTGDGKNKINECICYVDFHKRNFSNKNNFVQERHPWVETTTNVINFNCKY